MKFIDEALIRIEAPVFRLLGGLGLIDGGGPIHHAHGLLLVGHVPHDHLQLRFLLVGPEHACGSIKALVDPLRGYFLPVRIRHPVRVQIGARCGCVARYLCRGVDRQSLVGDNGGGLRGRRGRLLLAELGGRAGGEEGTTKYQNCTAHALQSRVAVYEQ